MDDNEESFILQIKWNINYSKIKTRFVHIKIHFILFFYFSKCLIFYQNFHNILKI